MPNPRPSRGAKGCGRSNPPKGNRERAYGGGKLYWLAFSSLAVAAAATAVLAARFDRFPGDLAALQALRAARTPLLDQVMLGVTVIGAEPSSVVIVALASIALWEAKLRVEAGLALLTILGDVSGFVLKVVVARPRPPEEFLLEIDSRPDFSFPSGHALHAVLFYGFLAFVLWRSTRSRWWRLGSAVALGILVLLTGVSRIYLGAHWPSDVLGGYLVGLVWLMGLLKVYAVARQ